MVRDAVAERVAHSAAQGNSGGAYGGGGAVRGSVTAATLRRCVVAAALKFLTWQFMALARASGLRRSSDDYAFGSTRWARLSITTGRDISPKHVVAAINDDQKATQSRTGMTISSSADWVNRTPLI